MTDAILSLHTHLDSQPDDWLARSILADAHEEEGMDREAAYYRWTVREEKCPGKSSRGWEWWIVSSPSIHANIPSILFGSLAGNSIYPSRQLAEFDLCQVLEELGMLSEGEANKDACVRVVKWNREQTMHLYERLGRSEESS